MNTLITPGSNLEQIYNLVHNNIKNDIIAYLNNNDTIIFNDIKKHINIYSNIGSSYPHNKIILYCINFNTGYNGFIAYYIDTNMYTYEYQSIIDYQTDMWIYMEEYINKILFDFMIYNDRFYGLSTK
jgi:hypothetical protein